MYNIAGFFGRHKCQEAGQVELYFVTYVKLKANRKLDIYLNLHLSIKSDIIHVET